MGENNPQQEHHSDNASRIVITIVGAALVVIGLGMLARQWFWPYLPIQHIWNVVRGAGWGLGLIVIGIVAIIWTQRPGFKSPARGAKIYRSRKNRMLGGVLGGLAEYLSVDATLVRLAYVAFALIFEAWPAIVAYIAAAIIVPEEPKDGSARTQAPPMPAPPPPQA